MEGGGSSSLGGRKKSKKAGAKKTDRSRRAWNAREEAVLAELMKELVTSGWRSGLGFKPGYLGRLEAGMAQRIPGTDIRANPHITSRITIWKKFHGSLLGMLGDNSGIGFNPTTGIIDCHDDAWNLIVKADPNAANMRYKAWTLYEDWNEIFGKDKANGSIAEDVEEAVNGLEGENECPTGQGTHDPSDVDREEVPIDMEENSEAHTNSRAAAGSSRGKKRGLESIPTPTDKICEVLVQMNNSSDIRMDNLVRVLGYDSNLAAQRTELFSVLDNIVGLSEDNKVDVAHILAKNAECLGLFLGMNPASRVRYALRLVSGELKI